MAKGKKIDSRVLVKVGTYKAKVNGKSQTINVYSKMRGSVAQKLKLKAAQETTVKKGKKVIPIRGVRHGSIQVPDGDKRTAKGAPKYLAVPMGPLPLVEIQKFVRQMPSKPKYFVSKDGITHPVSGR